jgi:hypothetical protein
MKKVVINKKVVIILAASVLLIAAAITAFLIIRGRLNDGGIKNIIGNSNGNIANVGFAAAQGEWIYYVGTLGGINRMRLDGSDKTAILPEFTSAYCLNVVGDWIYFLGEGDRIFKVRLDGSELTKLNDHESGYLTVIGDWMFFTDTQHNMNIYRMRTDGTDAAKLNEDASEYVVVSGDWIYYVNADEDYAMYRIRLNGTDRTLIHDADCSYLNVVGNHIYYIESVFREHDGREFERVLRLSLDLKNPDGTFVRTLISDDNADNLNVHENWFYYANLDDDGKIYRARVDTEGSHREKVNDMDSENLNVVGGWIFFTTGFNGEYGFVHKVRHNGTGSEFIP